MSHQHILIYIIVFSVGFHIASCIEYTINKDSLNYGIYSNSNCSNPVAFGSVDYYLDNNQSAQYKTIFNSDEYYYLYRDTGNIYLNITSSNTTSKYEIPTNQTCVKGINGYYYQFNQRTGRIGDNGYDPTLVYFGIQSSLCGAVSIMVTLPNNEIPSILGFVDIKYPLLNIDKSILNGTTFNCGECGDGRCMDTYQFVNHEGFDVDIQFNLNSNSLMVKGSGCKSFLSHTIRYGSYGRFVDRQSDCNSNWIFNTYNTILPEDILIESNWNSSNEFFPINPKTIQNKYVLPKLMYLTGATRSAISFKVNNSSDFHDNFLLVTLSYINGDIGDQRYIVGDSNQFTFYKNLYSLNPSILNVKIFMSEYRLCVTPYEGPLDISVTVKTTSIVLTSPTEFLSVSIGDRFVYCGYGYSVTIDSLKPDTMYNIRVTQRSSIEDTFYCTFQQIGYLNVITKSGLSTPLIDSIMYQKQEYNGSNENGNVTLSFHSTTGYGSIKYSVSMNNRFIPTCYQTQYTNCTFTPISPLQVNQQYKLRIVAYIDGETKSTTYNLMLNQSNHLELQLRSPIIPNFQPTLPTLPPTTPPSPFQNTTSNDTIIVIMDSSCSVSITNFQNLTTLIMILILQLLIKIK